MAVQEGGIRIVALESKPVVLVESNPVVVVVAIPAVPEEPGQLPTAGQLAAPHTVSLSRRQAHLARSPGCSANSRSTAV